MKKYSLISLLKKDSVKSLFEILNTKTNEARLVGGCIRDSILGRETSDIDVATNIKPNAIIKILNNHNIEYNDYAYKYGSITAIIKHQKFQITSLRKDYNQIGRASNVAFTNDWKIDAERRDFTINAIYLSSDGTITDYFNGQKDLSISKLQFIGNIENRIKEDFLRIYRYYRFLGIYQNPLIDSNDEKILQKYFPESFKYLPNYLIRQEILKMFNNSYPLNSFYNHNKEKKYWVELTKNHFIKNKYDIGLNKCLNKINLLI